MSETSPSSDLGSGFVVLPRKQDFLPESDCVDAFFKNDKIVTHRNFRH